MNKEYTFSEAAIAVVAAIIFSHFVSDHEFGGTEDKDIQNAVGAAKALLKEASLKSPRR